MVKKGQKYFERQIIGLLMIISEGDGIMVARSYVAEKLNKILSGSGISFHPCIKERLEMEDD